MTESIFWELIDIAAQRAAGDFEMETDLLVDFLLDFTIDDICDFTQILKEKMDDLASTEIFAVFYIIFNDEPSADYFFNFRAWLLARGRSAYRQLLENPAFLDYSIGPADKEIIRGQAFSQVAPLAFFVKTRRHDFPGPDIRESVEVEIPVTEGEIRKRYGPEFPALMEKFWTEPASL